MKKIAAIQMCSNDNLEHNLSLAKNLIAQAAKQQAKLIVLPEMFATLGMDKKHFTSETIGDGVIQYFLRDEALKHQIWIVGGTIPIACKDPNKSRAACLVFNDKGEIAARYDKMHLFDVTLSAHEFYRESERIEPGHEPIVFDSPLGKIGLAVCYDLRFPELFRILFAKGAEIIIVPAAFTAKTGEAHWEVLMRARAIENFSYVIGACEWGTHPNARQTFGHSLIIDPWGKIITSLPEGNGIITAEIDLEHLKKVRAAIPVGEHRRIVFHTPLN